MLTTGPEKQRGPTKNPQPLTFNTRAFSPSCHEEVDNDVEEDAEVACQWATMTKSTSLTRRFLCYRYRLSFQNSAVVRSAAATPLSHCRWLLARAVLKPRPKSWPISDQKQRTKSLRSKPVVRIFVRALRFGHGHELTPLARADRDSCSRNQNCFFALRHWNQKNPGTTFLCSRPNLNNRANPLCYPLQNMTGGDAVSLVATKSCQRKMTSVDMSWYITHAAAHGSSRAEPTSCTMEVVGTTTELVGSRAFCRQQPSSNSWHSSHTPCRQYSQ